MKNNQYKSQYTLAELTTGLDVVLQGDPNCLIEGVCTIQQAQPGRITFLMNSLYKKYLPTTCAAAVILSKTDAVDCPVNAIVTSDPYYIYAKIAAYFERKPLFSSSIHPSAVIGKDCQINSAVSISPNCVIGDRVKLAAGVVLGPGCVVGDDSEMGEQTCVDANVTVYHDIKIGKNVHISSGVVIGSDGFGIAKHKGSWHKVPQLGRVIIGDNVDIGANCAIDRGAIEDTVIESGVRLDNLIQVAHNVRIGQNTAVAGCVGISGSAVIGKNCLIGGAACIAGHVTIADNTVIAGMTAVSKSIREPGMYCSGIGGLVTKMEWQKNSARVLRLGHLMERVKELESALAELTEREK